MDEGTRLPLTHLSTGLSERQDLLPLASELWSFPSTVPAEWSVRRHPINNSSPDSAPTAVFTHCMGGRRVKLTFSVP